MEKKTYEPSKLDTNGNLSFYVVRYDCVSICIVDDTPVFMCCQCINLNAWTYCVRTIQFDGFMFKCFKWVSLEESPACVRFVAFYLLLTSIYQWVNVSVYSFVVFFLYFCFSRCCLFQFVLFLFRIGFSSLFCRTRGFFAIIYSCWPELFMCEIFFSSSSLLRSFVRLFFGNFFCHAVTA